MLRFTSAFTLVESELFYGNKVLLDKNLHYKPGRVRVAIDSNIPLILRRVGHFNRFIYDRMAERFTLNVSGYTSRIL